MYDDSVSPVTEWVHPVTSVKTRNARDAKFRDASMVPHPQSNQCVIYRKQDKNHMTISTDAAKASDSLRPLLTVTCQAPLSKGFSRQE